MSLCLLILIVVDLKILLTRVIKSACNLITQFRLAPESIESCVVIVIVVKVNIFPRNWSYEDTVTLLIKVS